MSYVLKHCDILSLKISLLCTRKTSVSVGTCVLLRLLLLQRKEDQKISIHQWFPKFNVHCNHLERWLNTDYWTPSPHSAGLRVKAPEFSFPRWCWCTWPRTTLWRLLQYIKDLHKISPMLEMKKLRLQEAKVLKSQS